jgi:mRNA interferase RelE/StbE
VYRIEWSARAARQLEKLDVQAARAVVGFMSERVAQAEDPRTFGRPLRGESLWRYRVADYRILCHIKDRVMVVLVVEVGHRREVYR